VQLKFYGDQCRSCHDTVIFQKLSLTKKRSFFETVLLKV
jgi:hypothetical protein